MDSEKYEYQVGYQGDLYRICYDSDLSSSLYYNTSCPVGLETLEMNCQVAGFALMSSEGLSWLLQPNETAFRQELREN
eukprot:5434615-Prymnesium_polylepis.1